MKKTLGFFRRPELGIGWLFVITCVLFAYAMFQGGFVSWFLFYGILPIFLYVVSVAVYPLEKVQVERSLAGEVFTAGAKLVVTVDIYRKSRLPLLFLVVEDRLPGTLAGTARAEMKDYRFGAKAIFFPGFRQSLRYRYTLEPLPRGEFSLSEFELKIGDAFGWFEKSRIALTDQQLLVYPAFEEIHHWDPQERHEEGERRGKNLFQFDLTSVSGVRDYSTGDRLSWVDWKSTARTNKLLTKEFERPLNEDFVICLDRRADHFRGRADWFETGVSAAASMVRYGMKKGGSVGFVSCGKEKGIYPLASDSHQQWRIFHHLAMVQPDGTGNPFPLLIQSLRRFPAKVNVIFITSVVSDATLRLFDEMQRRNQKADLFLLSESSSSAREDFRVERLRRTGVGVYMIGNGNLSEVLNMGSHYATNG
ncbi:MAG TPA: DUF58 domain-containing protein [Bacillales bacterium]|nr:DUF58 domain-containing protein [Bacillales bacterium]